MVEPMRADDTKYTYADVLDWPEDERWELIDGVAYDMTPAPSRRHQDILRVLFRQFDRALEGSPCRVYFAPFDVRLPKPGEDGFTSSTVVQPDLTVICDREKLDEHGAVGSPTLVVEILSPSTAKKDRDLKMKVYARAGVPEYWIIASREKTVEVYRLEESGRYGTATTYLHNEQVPVGVLPELVIDLVPVFAEE